MKVRNEKQQQYKDQMNNSRNKKKQKTQEISNSGHLIWESNFEEILIFNLDKQ